MRLNLAALGLAIGLAGCVTESAPPPAPTSMAPFDATAAAYFLKPGKGRIEGQAFLKQANGAVVTAAGNPVTMFPATAYMDEWMARQPPENPAPLADHPPLALPTDPALAPYFKTVTADTTGSFVFDKLSPGDYWLTSRVTWTVPAQFGPAQTGGNVALRVHVNAGEVVKAVVTRPDAPQTGFQKWMNTPLF